jgi:hypothetical protein
MRVEPWFGAHFVFEAMKDYLNPLSTTPNTTLTKSLIASNFTNWIQVAFGCHS